MMQFSRKISVVVLASLLASGPALAQNIIKPREEPAEYPPASYTGKQYVDSKGCVFIRAGFDGQVTWVPRLARNRTQVCGFQPTQVAGTTQAGPAFARNNPVEITAAVPETSAAAAAAPVATAAERVAPAVAAAVPVRTARVVAPKPSAAPVASVAGPATRVKPSYVAPAVRVPPAPVVEAKPRVVAPAQAAPRAVTGVSSPCSGLSPAGQQYMSRGTGGYEVRCGPQAEYDPYGAGGRAVVAGAPRVVAPGYAAPSHGAGTLPSYEKRAPAKANKPGLFGGRKQQVVRTVTARTTAQGGISPQARVLPEPVYRQRVLSQDVKVPRGYRPVWEDDRLNPRRAEQTLAGKKQMEMVWTNTVPRRLVPVQVVPQGQAAPRYASPRVSTRDAAPKGRKAGPLAGRFVQIGGFHTPDNAQVTAQRLQAAGLPEKIRKASGGQIVIAGPFADDRAVGSALNAARRAGFPGAFPRN
jgi:hypothetical protein